MSGRIEVTTWPNGFAKDFAGNPVRGTRIATTTLELFERFRTPRVLPHGLDTKDAIDRAKMRSPSWSPATYRDGVRSLATCESLSGVGFDIDLGDVPELVRLCSALERFSGLVHTTASHVPEVPRFRVILWTNRTITPDEYKLIHRWGVPQIQGAAPAVKDPSRQWFQPIVRPGFEYSCELLPGAPVDVDTVLASMALPTVTPALPVELQGGHVANDGVEPTRPHPKPFAYPGVRRSSSRAVVGAWTPLNRARAWLAARGSWTCPHGATRPGCRAQRCHDTLFSVAAAVARGFELDDFDALSALTDWNQGNTPGFLDEHITEQIDRARKHGTMPIGFYLNAPKRRAS